MPEEPHRAVLWFVISILIIMLALQLAANVHLSVSVPKFPVPPNYYQNMTISNETLLNDILQLPVNPTNLTNDSNLKVFVSNGTGIPLKEAILRILAYNATQIAPGPYWAVADLAGALQPTNIVYREYNVSVYNGTNVTLYHVKLPFFNASPYNTTYPPSDKVLVNSPVYRIINAYSVYAYVVSSPQYSKQLVYSWSYSYPVGNITYVCVYNYYDENVWGTAYLYANGKLIASQPYSATFCWWQYGTYSGTIYGNVVVPPGVEKQVYASYTITTWPDYSSYSYSEGNTVYIINNFYPSPPSFSSQNYYFNWYEYNVSVGVTIEVYNGTHPVTVIGNKTYTGRVIDTSFWFTVWSSDPVDYTSPMIVTYDHITVANYTLDRKWVAGEVVITTSSYESQQGNMINYYLTVSVDTSKIAKQPSWVFHHIPKEEVYKHDFALELLQGPAYLYGLNKYLTNYFSGKYANYTALAFFMSIANNIKQTNSTKLLPPAVVIENYSGPALEVRNLNLYFASFSLPWLNYSIPNASMGIVGPLGLPFNYTKVLVNNEPGLMVTSFIWGLANVSKIQNGTYTFYKWLNWDSGAVLFEESEYANYSVEFLGI